MKKKAVHLVMDSLEEMLKLPYEQYMEVRAEKLREAAKKRPLIGVLMSYGGAWEMTQLIWTRQWMAANNPQIQS